MAKYEKCPEHYIFGLDIGTRSIVGTVGYREDEKYFRVIAQVVRMHETRAMLDGQIHDIEKVAESIRHVKSDLEERIGYTLEKVCIAAAGRVLKTVTIRADLDLEEETVIDGEYIHSMELLGMENAYEELKKSMKQDVNMYCVGSTVIHYYLDDYIMLNLEGHKGKKISADFLATFLPDEVIDSLYVAVEKAQLTVANLTLEPIAASEVAIPVNYRLLNIALVDVGAGTSDISITKDGSIIGYGMIPTAGDTFTEEIAKKYLVDFDGAEKIKMACFSSKTVRYKDILGVSHKVSSEEILEGLKDTISQTTKRVADKILELNGGVPVSAVFIVGGGGKIPNFAETLAENLNIPNERVAVRGKEILGSVIFDQPDIKVDSTLVTPIGICLTYLSKNNTIIMVSLNGRLIKLYDNSKLTVMDAALQIGFPKDNLFPKRGKELNYTLNNEARMIRGEAGEGAKITINGKAAGFNSKIAADDIIEIIPSTAGAEAKGVIGDIPEFKRKGEIQFVVNGNAIVCPRMAKVNGEIALETQEICENDRVEILDYYVMSELMEFMDMQMPVYFTINGKEADWDDRIYDAYTVDFHVEEPGSERPEDLVEEIRKQDTEPAVSENAKLENLPGNRSENALSAEDAAANSEGAESQSTGNTETAPVMETQGVHDIVVTVYGTSVTLSNKEAYVFVDILDFYPFDTTVVGGSAIVTKINGMDATFSSEIRSGDQIELYWKE